MTRCRRCRSQRTRIRHSSVFRWREWVSPTKVFLILPSDIPHFTSRGSATFLTTEAGRLKVTPMTQLRYFSTRAPWVNSKKTHSRLLSTWICPQMFTIKSTDEEQGDTAFYEHLQKYRGSSRFWRTTWTSRRSAWSSYCITSPTSYLGWSSICLIWPLPSLGWLSTSPSKSLKRILSLPQRGLNTIRSRNGTSKSSSYSYARCFFWTCFSFISWMFSLIFQLTSRTNAK